MKFAIPIAQGQLCLHFGHCEEFAIIEIDENREIESKEMVTPPPHQPGLLPRWLGEHNVNVVIAGGMGSRAIQLFNAQGIEVLTGATPLPPEDLVESYLANTIQTGPNACDH